MQSPQAKVAALAGKDAERARRLLNQFSDNEERIGALLDALAQADVDPNLKPEDVQRLLEEEDGRSTVEEQDAKLKEVLRAGAGQAAQLEERLLRAAYGSKWQEHQESRRLGLGGNVQQMGSALQQGLKERDRLIKENQALLAQALQAVEAALAQTVGKARGDAEIDPNRLHGVVLHHLAEAKRREADALRRRAGAFLDRLVSLGVEARDFELEKNLRTASGIATQIADAEAKRAQAEAALAKAKTAEADLQSKIDAMKATIAELQSTADAARAQMERMEEQGARLDYAGGFEQFARQFNDLALRYREALAQAHALEMGTLRNARIDSSGDLIKGQYVPADPGTPVAPDAALPGLERELATAQLGVTAAHGALAACRDELPRLNAMQAEYRQRGIVAEARLIKVAETAGKAYGDFERLAAEAETAEEESVKRYTRSMGAFNTAARAAQERASTADSALANLSEEAKARAPAQSVAADAWFEQQFKVNAADAQIRLGSLHYRVWSEDERIAKALADLPASLGLREVAPDAWTQKATAAKTAERSASKWIGLHCK
jgi:hypothetical protein